MNHFVKLTKNDYKFIFYPILLVVTLFTVYLIVESLHYTELA